LPLQDALEIGDARAMVFDFNYQGLRRGLAIYQKLDSAAARVIERIARDFRHGGGDARLILGLETQQPRYLSRAPPRSDYVVLILDRDCQNRPSHNKTK
jgi:hypothetical protein